MNPAVAPVIQAEEGLAQAHVDMDLATIAELLHPDYVILQPDGQTESRQAVLDSYRTGDRRWDLAQVGEMDVRLHGETAVVVGRWRARGQNGAEYFIAGCLVSRWWVGYNVARKKTGSAELSAAFRLRVCL